MPCGIPSSTLTVSGAGTADVNGTYEQVSSNQWNKTGDGYVLFHNEGSALWFVLNEAAVTLYSVLVEDFPCGPWNVVLGDSPAPTFTYASQSPACNLETILNSAGSCQFQCLTQVQLLQIIAQLSANWLLLVNPSANISLAAIQERACASGIGRLQNEVNLLRIISQNLCNLIE